MPCSSFIKSAAISIPSASGFFAVLILFITSSGTLIPAMFLFRNCALFSDLRGIMPAIIFTLFSRASLTLYKKSANFPASKTACVWIKAAPILIFFLSFMSAASFSSVFVTAPVQRSVLPSSRFPEKSNPLFNFWINPRSCTESRS
ncbi:Uncharacterised protein [uncultured archaeon]|nr:Uncharacterised protein [uncultured archaeon]